MKKKGAIEFDMVGWLIISLVVAAIFLISYFILSGKLEGAGEFFRNLFRFGR